MMRDVIDDLRMTPCELRKKFQSAGFANAETLVPQRGNLMTFPCSRSVVVGKELLMDICGYLKVLKDV